MPARSIDNILPSQPINVNAVSTNSPEITEVSALAYQCFWTYMLHSYSMLPTTMKMSRLTEGVTSPIM